MYVYNVRNILAKEKKTEKYACVLYVCSMKRLITLVKREKGVKVFLMQTFAQQH